ncbi:hypothetical protein B0H66DRAFT_520060 [Apodospora peruviana]|uniref:NmrA-like domain-containing protein n=1 Tax=Apodospora peruviana TaxID=516989 RepID=A0AAE0M2M9_9PEZI|nr:hypothetical protein B0H66DRAFT_520060 [Apodospora peruviana]
MTTIKNVAVAGAAGTIGRPIVTHLLASNLFTKITVLTRDASRPLPFPPGSIIIKQVDYSSLSSLESALRGCDAAVSALSFDAISNQTLLVKAAANVGTVKRFIPSEYGNDTLNPLLATIPIYQPKIAIRSLCEQLAVSHPSFSWTTIQNASFLAADWTLDFIVDVKNRRADIKDGGDVLFCATTYEDVAQAVVGVLMNLEETANRPVRTSSVETTQNDIVSIAKDTLVELEGVGKGKDWTVTYSRTEELEAQARKRWAEGDRSEEVVAMFINRAFIGEGWGGYFPVRDNGLLGIKGIGREGLKRIVKERLGME